LQTGWRRFFDPFDGVLKRETTFIVFRTFRYLDLPGPEKRYRFHGDSDASGWQGEGERSNESEGLRRRCEAWSSLFGSPINMAAYKQALGMMLERVVRTIKNLSLCRNPFETISKDYELVGRSKIHPFTDASFQIQDACRPLIITFCIR
jgi:hypothetical protein